MSRCGLGRGFSRGRALLAFALLLMAGTIALKSGLGVDDSRRASSIHSTPVQPVFMSHPVATLDKQQIRTAFAQLPLMFEPNEGQTDARVKFLARGGGYALFLTANEAVLSLQAPKSSSLGSEVSDSSPSANASFVRMQLRGANTGGPVSAAGELPGKSSYFIGNDPARWRRGIQQFARVRYHDVYPGIDLVYYGNQGRLEYDFEVASGADPRQVALRFQGAERVALEDGVLILHTGSGDLTYQAPRVYQVVGSEQKSVSGKFVLRGKNEVGFELGPYDRSRALIIDPVLTYSTYLGGAGDEASPKIAVDLGFNVYIAGTTTSATFPIPSGGTPPTLKGPSDVFVAKLNNSGSALLFATYVGGSGTDTNAGVAIDSGFNVAITGTTDSTDFPTVNNFQTPTLAAGNHVFVTEVESSGSALLYSTYLGGNGTEQASGVAVDVKNKIYVIGNTTSTDFPTTVGAFQATSLATNQLFLSKVDPSTSGTQSLVYSSYFGGGNPANGTVTAGGIAVDSSSNAYITGSTNFVHTGANSTTDFPILNAVQACLDAPTNPSPCPAATATDIFVAKINPAAATGSQLQYSTYLGGSGDDTATGIAVDTGGDAYVTGSTLSTDWNIPSEVLEPQSAHNCTGVTPPAPCSTTDAFLAKLGNFTLTTTTTTGTVPNLYFTYLGGSSDDSGLAVTVDTAGGAQVTGFTNSADFPVTTANALQTVSGGGTDAFLARIDTTSSAPTHYISYLGGSGTDRGTGIAVDSEESAYVAGDTTSPNFPLAAPLQGTLSGASDAFVSKFGPTVNLALTAAVSPTPSGVGNSITFTYTVTNNGDLTTGITFTDTLSGSASLSSATSSGGSCGTVTGSPPSVTCSVGTLDSSSITPPTTTVTIVVVPTSAGPLGNTGTLTVLGSNFSASASATATINDFSVAVSPASQSTPAGTPVSYTATVSPTGGFPNSVSISCSAGLPTGASCSATNNPITNLNTGAQSRALVVNTTARTTTTSQVRQSGRPFYVAWLPVSGLALLGLGAGGKKRWRWVAALLFGALLTLTMLQAGCGSTKTTTTTTGTPAGTYTVGVTATSGSASRTTTMQLIVQ